MPIVFRYVFRQVGNALLLILLSLGGVVWIALALKQLNVVTSQGQNAWTLIQMTLLALPNLLAIIAPFALLIAVIHTLSRLNGDSELIVLTASGGTIWDVAKPLLFLAAIVMAAITFVNHVGMPWSLRQLRQYVIDVRTDLLTQVIQPGRFSTPELGLTFHIRDRTPSGELLDLMVQDSRDAKESRAYLAERGRIIKQNKTAYLIMSNGHILRREAGDKPAQVIAFDRYMVDLDQFDRQATQVLDLKPRERYLHELVSPEPSSKFYKLQPGHFRAELHERFSNPLYPIAFVLIALAAAGQAQSIRQNRAEPMVIALVAATSCRLAGLAVNNLVAINPIYVPLLYAIPILTIGIALFYMDRNARPHATFSIFDWIADTLKPWIDRIAQSWRRYQAAKYERGN